jgi:hypothetical protein
MQGARRIPDDVRQMLGDVCAEYQVRIDPDDPAVAIIMLNRLVLEAALTGAVERIETATAQLNAQVDAAQLRAGAMLAQEFRTAIRTLDANASSAPKEGKSRPASSTPVFRIAAAVVLFSLGVWAGLLIR